MSKKLYTSFMVYVLSFSAVYAQKERKAVTIVPVADLLSQSLTSRNKTHKTQLSYQTIPISGKNENKACPRLHQLIFNEEVTILEELNDEVKVHVTNHFCQPEQSDAKQSTYWTAKKNVITFDELKKLGVDISIIPPPLSHHTPQAFDEQIVTLKYPFADPSSSLSFSVGTRFVKMSMQSNKQSVTVHFFNPREKKQKQLFLPLRYLATDHKNQQEKIDEYVKLIRSWAHETKGVIPYVWGGCSFITLCKQEPFVEKKDNDTNPYYLRKDRLRGPQDGLDCSGLILRGTQLCDIPYFFKNSTTLAKNLAPLHKNEPIENGDMIWFPGHVVVVSDVKNNLVVEARGYEHGYGVVQETPLKEQFKNIATYDELKKAFHNKTPIERLDKFGTTVKTLTNYKILKLKSVWHTANSNKHIR